MTKATPPEKPTSPASAKAQQTERLAAAMPFNALKPMEHGTANAKQPRVGPTLAPESRLPTGSTLSEENGTQKTGSMAPEGVNATIEPLDRVRVDSDGQMLTTNQGVAIADNQNSLKAGLRGPVLLEDFILREKLTHFDHERIPERSHLLNGDVDPGIMISEEVDQACLNTFIKAIACHRHPQREIQITTKRRG